MLSKVETEILIYDRPPLRNHQHAQFYLTQREFTGNLCFYTSQIPPGFRPRRGLNWGFLGLLYTSFYMCRYNLSLANKAITDEYGYSHAQMEQIITQIKVGIGQVDRFTGF